ncbi:MAG TPA: class I SAM-dependent methyltransferase, partial [Pyrinomonadaceae bacterium]|nr:class I SAM-dependent methyltransferase [Pyrinomonadaceae bacterium]
MASTSKIISDPLPQEMQQHTYSIMYQVEGAHWWFVGRRLIIESFLAPLCHKLQAERGPAAQSDLAIKILDIGCGTGGNLEMLARFGAAEGVDVSADALAFCR